MFIEIYGLHITAIFSVFLACFSVFFVYIFPKSIETAPSCNQLGAQLSIVCACSAFQSDAVVARVNKLFSITSSRYK